MQLGNGTCIPHQLTMVLPQRSHYTKGLAYLNQTGLNRVLSLAEGGLNRVLPLAEGGLNLVLPLAEGGLNRVLPLAEGGLNRVLPLADSGLNRVLPLADGGLLCKTRGIHMQPKQRNKNWKKIPMVPKQWTFQRFEQGKKQRVVFWSTEW